MSNKEFKFIDLFCGLGGFRISLEQLGGKCVFSSDIDKYIQEVYENNFGEKPYGDIKTMDEKDVPDHDILCGGFPCQPFSIAGKRLGFGDDRGTLFFDIYRIIKEKKPKIIFLENVKGIINHDNGNTLNIIENSLTDLGYKISFKVINAKNFGLPQNRERFILVGFSDYYKDIDIKDFSIPESNKKESIDLKVLLDLDDKQSNISERCDFNMKSHFTDDIRRLIEEGQIVLAHNIRPSKCSFAYKNFSPCLTAKMGTGGNNVPVIANTSRKISVKECLSLMGFPENYIMRENYGQSYKQIGNSVAIPMIKEVGESIVRFI